MSRFFCDTNSELWFSCADKLGLDVIQMPYSLDGEEKVYDLGRNTDFKAFYDALKNGADAKTQALNMQNYIDYFEPVLKSGEDIIYVHFSRNMSGTFAQMDSAISYLKEKYPNRKISVVDTKLISIGEAMLVYESAKLWKSGATDEEVIKFVEDNRQKTAVYFMVKDLVQLKRGGRISAISYVAGTLLNIKPVLRVQEDGRLDKYCTAKGVKGGLKTIVQKVRELGDEIYSHPILIAQADAEDLANELKQMLIAEFGENLKIYIQPIGPTVGTHCGSGTVGIAFHSKSR
jgi:DegV family protein with EDD domain